MNDEVQPPRSGEPESAGESALPSRSVSVPASWPGSYPPPGQQAGWPSGQQAGQQFGQPPAGPFPPGAELAWGIPPTPVRPRDNRRLAFVGVGVGALVVVGVLIAVLVLSGSGKSTSPAAAGPSSPGVPSPTASAAAQGATPTDAASTASTTSTTQALPPEPCPTAASLSSEPVGYRACGTAAKNVGIPTYDAAQARRTYTVTLKTNHGNIVFTAKGASAPYTVYNFLYLVQKQYFDATKCHRLTTKGIYVLQCGDPTGSGSGGPGYEFQDENLNAFGPASSNSGVDYPAGTVAMANAGLGTNGSQFFLVYRDTRLPPLYTPFGKITQGLDILTTIARLGTDNANGDGDGSPNDPVNLEQVTMSAS